MKTLNVVAVCWTTTLLALSGCGRTPVEETADGTATGSATDTDATAGSATQTTGSAGSVSDSMNPTDTGGSMSASQTETGDPTSTTAPATVTATDTEPDPTVTATATETTTPSDPSVGESSSDTSSTGDSQSASDTSTSTSTSDTTDGTSTGADTTTTSDGTTSGTTGEEVQCGLQLQVTIRDFKFSHPDMEDYCCGQVNGLVQPDLGMNNKPVFAMVGNPKMLTDAPTFTQWYTDVPDVNQKTTIVIDLMEIMPGVYSYQNNSFFPVDNMLWGNEGQAHNYHFTTVHDTS